MSASARHPSRGAALPTFFGGGFECSTHRRSDGDRLDLVAATAHDRWAQADYAALAALGLRWARDGLRWHHAEPAPGRFDFSGFTPRLRAARDAGVTVVWDLCHYGWPDGLDIWTPAFPRRFARFARAAAEVVKAETDAVPYWCPINEISYWSWAGGDMAQMGPHARGRGFELKVQLARAALAAADAVRDVDRRARLLWAEPVIHVVPNPARPDEAAQAEHFRQAQYQAWDLIAGKLWPQAGGSEEMLDIVGVNYYDHNQWVHGGAHISPGHPHYRPFREMLQEVGARYDRLLVVSETGVEGPARAAWLRRIAQEVGAARTAGVPVEGVCWYPILDYPGWEDGSRRPSGLFGYAGAGGRRPVYAPLAAELRAQQAQMGEAPPLDGSRSAPLSPVYRGAAHARRDTVQ
jgi:beta-glucosidase/6-phospho-beta-glucosidase/beta-galactosidase